MFSRSNAYMYGICSVRQKAMGIRRGVMGSGFKCYYTAIYPTVCIYYRWFFMNTSLFIREHLEQNVLRALSIF